MLQLLTNCTKNKIILNTSPTHLKLVLPVIVCGIISVNYSQNKKSSDKSKSDDDKLPEPPTNCCMSGCPNCVWVEYAEKLSKHFKDGGEEARKKILESVTDENMRAFLLMELRNMEKKNKK